MGDQPVSTYIRQRKPNKRGQTSFPRVGFEPTIPVLEGANTFHALDNAATVIDVCAQYTQDDRRCSELRNEVTDLRSKMYIGVLNGVFIYLKCQDNSDGIAIMVSAGAGITWYSD
jgi:hypothetical protein